MYRIILNDLLDLSEVVLDIGQDNGSFDSITNILHSERDIIISDNNNEYSPFNPAGFLNPENIGWKNKTIQIFDSDDILIYSGYVYDLADNENKDTKQIVLKTRSEIGNVLPYPIEVNDKETHSGFSLNGNHGKGTFLLLLKGGSTVLPEISIMTYNDSLVPSYQVTSPQGSPTVNINLDRGIESDLLDNQILNFSIPLLKTGAQAIKESLLLAFARIGQQDKINQGSFDAIHEIDAANNRYIWLFIRLNDNITLGQYIDQISLMTGYYIRQGKDGRIECINGIQWDGINPLKTITDDEIIYSISNKYNQDRLLYGYSLPYIKGNEIDLLNYYLPDLDPDLQLWGNQKIFSSDFNDILTIKNNYLYNNQTTAQYFGEKMLNYYKIPREQFYCSISENFVNGEPIRLKLFDVFLLTTNYYENEPVRCMSYVYDDRNGIYNNVILELINKDYPGLPKPI